MRKVLASADIDLGAPVPDHKFHLDYHNLVYYVITRMVNLLEKIALADLTGFMGNPPMSLIQP
jgi:hypothetical protein